VCEERGVKIEIEIEIEIEIDRSGNRNRNRNRNRGIIESDSCKLVVKWFFVQVFILLFKIFYHYYYYCAARIRSPSFSLDLSFNTTTNLPQAIAKIKMKSLSKWRFVNTQNIKNHCGHFRI